MKKLGFAMLLFLGTSPVALADNIGGDTTTLSEYAATPENYSRSLLMTRDVRDFGAKCDGKSDDTQAVQTAFDTSARMGIGLLVRGTCLASSVNVSTGVNVTGVGRGSGLRYLKKPNEAFFLFMKGDVGSVYIRDLFFDGAQLPQDRQTALIYHEPGSGKGVVDIEGNTFLNIPMDPACTQCTHAVQLYGVAYGHIAKNVVAQSGGDALNFNSGYYIVDGNRVNHVGDGCVAFNNSARGVISNNILSYCNLGVGAGPEGNALDSDVTQSITVTGNVFESNYIGVNFGWFGYPGRGAPVNWQIVGNTFRNTENVGVEYDGIMNTVVGLGSIVGNTFYGSGSTNYNGVKHDTPTDIRLGALRGVAISSNIIGSPTNPDLEHIAILLQSSTEYTISNNVITGDNNYSYSRGITVRASPNGTITGNTISYVGFGIIGEGGTGLSQVTVGNNSMSAVASAGIASGDPLNNTIMTGNKISGLAGSHGFIIPNGSKTFSIMGNQITLPSGDAIAGDPSGWSSYQQNNNLITIGNNPAQIQGTSGCILY